jgi:hypothetical protein
MGSRAGRREVPPAAQPTRALIFLGVRAAMPRGFQAPRCRKEARKEASATRACEPHCSDRSTREGRRKGMGMDVTKPYKFIGFGAMEVTKPYKSIGVGAMDVTKP